MTPLDLGGVFSFAMIKIFVSMKVPRGDLELEKLARQTQDVILAAGHIPFIATEEIAAQKLTSPKDFMPFVKQHVKAANLMVVLYHPELRGGLIELGLAYAQDIPIWLCHKTGEKVSSSAQGCAELTIEYTDLFDLQQKLSANLSAFANECKKERNDASNLHKPSLS